jgi:hypothetical protein
LEFTTSQVPFPQGYLGGKSSEHNRHLQDHEYTKCAQNQAHERKEKRGGLAGEDKPNRSGKDGVRRQVIGQEAMVIADA